MNLIGKKILLRELRIGDMLVLNNLINDNEISNNVVGWSKPVTMEEQNNWFKNLNKDNNIRYAICDLKDENNAIGTVIVSKIDWKNRSCSIDVKILTEKQGSGYGNESIVIILNYIFNELNMNRVFVNILDYNNSSIKMFEKNDFLLEGVQKQAIYKNGEYHSLLLYALLKEDYIKNERNRK